MAWPTIVAWVNTTKRRNIETSQPLCVSSSPFLAPPPRNTSRPSQDAPRPASLLWLVQARSYQRSSARARAR
eukprot:4117753-Pleurochrysis_carterae.AAC.1